MNKVDKNHEVNIAGFIGLVRYLSSDEKAINAFEKETRISMQEKSPIDRMIDSATGYDSHVFFSFCRWVGDNHYGAGDTPDFDVIFKESPNLNSWKEKEAKK